MKDRDISSEGSEFNQGRGLQSLWLNCDPKVEISLFYMEKLMMDCFSSNFPRLFVVYKNSKKNVKSLTFCLLGLHYF